MKYILMVIAFMLIVPTHVFGGDTPKCIQSDSWKYVLNNASRTAESYASKRNPRSTFLCLGDNETIQFEKQYGGKYKDGYLLFLTCKHAKNISFATLKPLFDVNVSADTLDDNKALWKVIEAKYNGIIY